MQLPPPVSSAPQGHDLRLLQTLHDLPSRGDFAAHLETELEKAVHTGAESAVLVISLQRFKRINESVGCENGDRVLQAVAERVQELIRPGDLLARQGGDEFIVLQADSPQPMASRSLANRITETIADPLRIGDQELMLAAAIGVAVAPFDAEDASSLIQHATLAADQAKAEGRNLTQYFEPSMGQRVRDKRSLEVELQRALTADEFRLVYQPVIGTGSGQVVMVEALIRWQHPEKGWISPGDFIPVAEETEFMKPIGRWALRQACRDAVQWPQEIGVAVNVSPVQLQDRQFVSDVIDTLRETGLPPQRLELEITENSLLGDTDLTIAILTELRQSGVRVAMDDFGTGYSSIGYLQRFPFDKIKIDRSFVSQSDQKSDSAAMVRMIASLGLSLEVVTTAEGVETCNELAVVKEAGCGQVQGYLVSKPVPVEQLIPIFSRKPPAPDSLPGPV